MSGFNPLTPKSDWHLISPYNIAPELNFKGTRIKGMVTNSQLLNKFSSSATKEM